MRPGEVLQLFDKHAFVIHVVGIRGEGGNRLGQTGDAEARLALVTGALHHVASEMRGGGGAAAIAADEDVPALRASLGKDLDRLVDLFQIDRLDGFQRFGSILFRERHT